MDIGVDNMQGITEYCKAFNNDYPFVYQDVLSNNFSNELFDVIKEYEGNLLGRIKLTENYYNTLKDEPIHRSPKNYSLFYDFDRKRIDKSIYKYFMMANQVGGQQAYRDFKIDEEYSPNTSSLLDIVFEAKQRANEVKSSYKNFVLEKLKTSFEKDKPFFDFVRSVIEYKNFTKNVPSTPYTPYNPDAKLVVENLVTSTVSRFTSDARIGVYENSRRVSKYIYKTRDDERVSSICRPWHNRVLDKGNITGIIPQHRNCRCSIVPFL